MENTAKVSYEEDGSVLNRSELWAATMQGNVSGDVVRAHKEAISYIPYDGSGIVQKNISSLYDVSSRCEIERMVFSSSATFSSAKGNRKRIEANNEKSYLESLEFRTNFEKDRDRILHCQAFRRLAGKTQVYLNPDDHQRTRLTHALEVAQIAKSIARALRLNDTLAEAIALGHDCGHGPGGHASEDAFDIFLPGGFHHATFGANVTLRRLNLCEETLDGIRNHSWSLDTPATPEAEVVSFADRIAYVCHDVEDALSCGLISKDDFPSEIADFMNLSRGEQIDYFVRGVISGTIKSESIAMEADCGEMLSAIRSFNHSRIYQHDLSVKQNEYVIRFLRELVNFYIDNPQYIPQKFRSSNMDSSEAITFSAVEYVAGMTDQYAYQKHSEHIRP